MDRLPLSGKMYLCHTDNDGNITEKRIRFPRQDAKFFSSLDDYIFLTLYGYIVLVVTFIMKLEKVDNLWMANLLHRLSKKVYLLASEYESEYRKSLVA